MRILLVILFGLVSGKVSSQTNPDSYSAFKLTSEEATVLNSVFLRERQDFDFNGKIVAFSGGVHGSQLEEKTPFFDRYVNPIIEVEGKKIIGLIVFSSDEKSNSGGFDAVVLSPVKIFTKSDRKRLISLLSEQVKTKSEF